jgi:glucose-6-phosphate 1-dehydrogenase
LKKRPERKTDFLRRGIFMSFYRTPEEPVSSKFLQTCDISVEELPLQPFAMVIFGGTGDLSRRKLLPTLFHIFQQGELVGEFSIIGIGRSPLGDEEYRRLVHDALIRFGERPVEEKAWGEFSRRLFYLAGELENGATYKDLSCRIGDQTPAGEDGRKRVVYYLAVPPQTTPAIVENLKKEGLCRGTVDAKIIVEKPFGQDLRSARRLNGILKEAFAEDQIYRMDHYLGKETVQNIIFFRFSNPIFEQLWNRRYIDNIQITVAEDLGIENRAFFYEKSGVVRDIVQNHILQVVGLIAMEPPIGFSADFIRDEKVKVFRALQPMEGKEIDLYAVRGQYARGKIDGAAVAAYREERGVDPASYTPTFFAGKFHIANWRWAGVPFYVRTGKRMSRRVTEVVIQFYQAPLKLFGRSCDVLDPNCLTLTVQPEEKISLRFGVKYPYSQNQIFPIDMNFCYQDVFKLPSPSPYQRLLIDCLRGDLTLFVRQDQIEAMWEAVDPILERWENSPPVDFPNYAAGTWGPVEAHRLLEREGRRWITT